MIEKGGQAIADYLAGVPIEWRRFKWNQRSNDMIGEKVVIPHILSDNMVEQFFSFIRAERFYPPARFVSELLMKVMTHHNNLWEKAIVHERSKVTPFTPYAVDCLAKESERGKIYSFHVVVTSIARMEGVVTQTHKIWNFSKSYSVNLKTKTCQCSLYDQYGTYCIHALKLLLALKEKIEVNDIDFVQPWCLKHFAVDEMALLTVLSPITEHDVEAFKNKGFDTLKVKIKVVDVEDVVSSKRIRGASEKSSTSSLPPNRFTKKRKFSSDCSPDAEAEAEELLIEWQEGSDTDESDNGVEMIVFDDHPENLSEEQEGSNKAIDVLLA